LYNPRKITYVRVLLRTGLTPLDRGARNTVTLIFIETCLFCQNKYKTSGPSAFIITTMALSFKPKQVNRNLLLVLPERTRDIVTSRFGLGDEPRRKTLESIGERYGITRERVRQIENFALQTIKKSPVFEEHQEAFDELHGVCTSLGCVVAEDDILEHVSKDESVRNHVFFLLLLGEPFERTKEDDHFKCRWIVDNELAKKVHQALHALHGDFSEDDIVSHTEILEAFKKRLSGVPDAYRKEDVLERWLNLSKIVERNPLGEWGLSSSPNIRARGIRDYAYLVIRRHGSPLHFTEVAKTINQLFDRPAHIATCHNELIKDKERFVLVGRGLYGLAEWGYANGVVRDVIKRLLEAEGAMSKEDLVEKVLLERHVKENTVVVNLQNKKYFKRTKDGRYSLS